MVGGYFSGFLSPYKFASNVVSRNSLFELGGKFQGPLYGWMVAQTVKWLPAMLETRVWSLGCEDLREQNGNPLQYSCLGDPIDSGAWQASPGATSNFSFQLNSQSVHTSVHENSGNTGTDCHWGFAPPRHQSTSGISRQILLPLCHLRRSVKSLSPVQLLATPWTETEEPGRLQSMGFSRPEYWSGLPFPSPRDLPDSGIKPGSLAL